MGEILLFTCAIVLCIVIYIVYKKDDKIPYEVYRNNQYQYCSGYRPDYVNYPNQGLPYYNSGYKLNNDYSNFKNQDYGYRAKMLQSPGYYLKNYVDSATKSPYNDISKMQNLNRLNNNSFINNDSNTPDSIHRFRYQGVNYGYDNSYFKNLSGTEDRFKRKTNATTQPPLENNYKIINAGDFFGKDFQDDEHSGQKTEMKKVQINSPNNSPLISLLKTKEPQKREHYPKSIIKRLEFSDTKKTFK